MEGVLHKWTNYMSGWQPRWFVLEGGTLSYYDSQEDAWKGCKGSIRVCVCEIQVHPTDLTRMDLTVPGEQYFYLKALNAAERQKWLVALGTAKACLTDNRTKREKELQENTKVLKTKMSELRLYCDLMLQQVGKLQESPPSEELGTIRGQEVGTLGKPLLKSTCSTFLKTLEECMLIASRTFSESESLLHSPTGLTPGAAVRPHKVKPHSRSSHFLIERKELSSKSGSGSTCDSDHLDHHLGPPAGELQNPLECSSTHLQSAASETSSTEDVGTEPEEAGVKCGAEPKTEEEALFCVEVHGNTTMSHQKDDARAVLDTGRGSSVSRSENGGQNKDIPEEDKRQKEVCQSRRPRAAQLTAAVGQDRGQEQQR